MARRNRTENNREGLELPFSSVSCIHKYMHPCTTMCMHESIQENTSEFMETKDWEKYTQERRQRRYFLNLEGKQFLFFYHSTLNRIIIETSQKHIKWLNMSTVNEEIQVLMTSCLTVNCV